MTKSSPSIWHLTKKAVLLWGKGLFLSGISLFLAVRRNRNRNGSPQDLYEITWMPHCTNKRCHVDSTCMTNLFNQVFVIGKFSRMYPTEQIDHTIDLGKLIKLTDRTIGQSYFLNGRTCTLMSIQKLNFRLGIQVWQQFWTFHSKNGLWFVSIYLTKIIKAVNWL